MVMCFVDLICLCICGIAWLVDYGLVCCLLTDVLVIWLGLFGWLVVVVLCGCCLDSVWVGCFGDCG